MEAGTPVLSVWQTDIIYYGSDPVSYLEHEFHLPSEHKGNGEKSARRIRFWSDIIDKAEAEFKAGRNDLSDPDAGLK